MEHPITPPPELVQQWRTQAPVARDAGATREQWIATQAARWGADQELEACCEWVQGFRQCGDALRTVRRPKPPSLKQQNISDLQSLAADLISHGLGCYTNTIRRALEALSDD